MLTCPMFTVLPLTGERARWNQSSSRILTADESLKLHFYLFAILLPRSLFDPKEASALLPLSLLPSEGNRPQFGDSSGLQGFRLVLCGKVR
ncbi:hypothetical protein OPV22_027917 [Ensete ventricosum]|uniref:Uncharacterized protein n=1 Tax=Ensete ventricosum TaxID=4639 RepID=A0AAV8Q8Z9_ENSVE|nr:hypothetical protein OPV22_027917 [Ensete ventricosum]